MSNDPKITDEKLKQELEEGKSYKQIAYENDYGWPSRQLARKIRDLGWEKLPKLSINEFGSANVSLNSEIVNQMLSNADLENTDNVFIKPEVQSDGSVVLKPTGRQYRRPEVREE